MATNKTTNTHQTTRCAAKIYLNIKEPVDVQKRKLLFDMIKKQKINFCSANTKLQFKKWLQAQGDISASDTLQYFVEYMGKPMMLKVSFDESPDVEHDKKDNSLAIERLVYQDVLNPLIFNRNTPHLIIHYATFQCNQRALLTSGAKSAQEKVKILKKIEKLHSEENYDIDTFHGLLLEKAKGISLTDFLETKTYTKDDIRQILFQIMWTLQCFAQVGLMHNDLHTGNVFVDEESKPVTRIYVSEEYTYELESKYTVKIFDFDRAGKVSTKNNQCTITNLRLENFDCGSYGMCNAPFDPHIDSVRLLFYVFHALAFHGHKDFLDFSLDLSALQFPERQIADFTWLKRLMPPAYVASGFTCRPTLTWCKKQPITSSMILPVTKLVQVLGTPFAWKTGGMFDAVRNNVCKLDNVYVLPSLMDKYGLTSCAITSSKPKKNVSPASASKSISPKPRGKVVQAVEKEKEVFENLLRSEKNITMTISEQKRAIEAAEKHLARSLEKVKSASKKAKKAKKTASQAKKKVAKAKKVLEKKSSSPKKATRDRGVSAAIKAARAEVRSLKKKEVAAKKEAVAAKKAVAKAKKEARAARREARVAKKGVRAAIKAARAEVRSLKKKEVAAKKAAVAARKAARAAKKGSAKKGSAKKRSAKKAASI